MKRILGTGLLVALLAVTLVILAGCGGSSGTTGSGSTGGSSGSGSTGGSTGGSSASEAAVTIQNFAFSPDSVTVNVGGTVTWTNKDSATHNVEGDGGISSGDMANGDTYSKTFDTAGTYSYKCAIHPSMTGEVVVK